MRRTLSIFLILLFSMGPLAAALPSSDDARLPACCRRHGAHHCAMSMRMDALITQFASGAPIVTAPATCPYYPGYDTASTMAIYALACAPAGLPGELTRPHSPAAAEAEARISQLRTRAGRGPPASRLF